MSAEVILIHLLQGIQFTPSNLSSSGIFGGMLVELCDMMYESDVFEPFKKYIATCKSEFEFKAQGP